jgi:hypothetical protein
LLQRVDEYKDVWSWSDRAILRAFQYNYRLADEVPSFAVSGLIHLNRWLLT